MSERARLESFVNLQVNTAVRVVDLKESIISTSALPGPDDVNASAKIACNAKISSSCCSCKSPAEQHIFVLDEDEIIKELGPLSTRATLVQTNPAKMSTSLPNAKHVLAYGHAAEKGLTVTNSGHLSGVS